jgi:acyl dehydratase
MKAKEIRYDDIEALRAEIKPEFGDWSDPIEVTQGMIDRYADLVGDHTWIHVDIERARRESPYGATIAHGNLVLSLFTNLPGGGSFDIVGYGNPVNYGFDKIRFLGAVRAGSRLQARARLAAVEVRSTGTLVSRDIEVRIAQTGELAFVCRPMVLYQPPAV